MKNFLVVSIVFLLLVIGIELAVVLLINKGVLFTKAIPALTSPNDNNPKTIPKGNGGVPIETGLLSAYLYFYEIKDLNITKKSSFIGEYEGVIKSIEFTKDKGLVFYFNDFSGWFTLYKKPSHFQETKCQTYDKAKGSYVDYTFAVPPFKVNDQVDIIYDFDFHNLVISCKIKVIN